jgi:acetolactate synthase I/II/III large subunit
MRVDRAVIADVRVDKTENCFPMIPSGKAHFEMILGDEAEAGDKKGEQKISEQGMVLV